MINRRIFLTHGVSLPTLQFAFPQTAISSTQPALYGCVIAFQRSDAPQCGPQIDFWTSRVSEFNPSALPRHIGQATVWDDLFPADEIVETFEAITNIYLPAWHGFARHKSGNRIGMHLSPFSSLDDAVRDSVPIRSTPALDRIALIDLTSVGIGTLSWTDFIPYLREYYDALVGIDYSADEDLLEQTIAQAVLCDLAFLCTDHTLGIFHQSRFDERQPLMDAMLRRLISSLEQETLKTFSALPTKNGWISVAHLPEPNP